ncbi:phage tail assembly chaperone [Vibrio paucivorans]|uniref:Phage tail assembly chaperone n=1 Tax=Vibrio paucivorans TaxID=2829489 RepID=A0A9X3CI17_9VIBR|nr:phage tail assembly chaperone [Vibrio paucivorans]MCW8336151.1 phage tail assembly chaperone [Vibrio paucivorans]
MSKLFSPSKMGVFDSELKEFYEKAGEWPSDLVEITPEEYDDFFSNAAPDGKSLDWTDNRLQWIDSPEPTIEEKERIERKWRDTELFTVDHTINQLDDNGLDSNIYRQYRIALRDYPQQEGFPYSPRPESPQPVAR